MGRIAVTEDVEGLRGEIDVGDEVPAAKTAERNEDVDMEEENAAEEQQKSPPLTGRDGKCVATLIEVQDAFDSINTLRYSQPIHLQGASHRRRFPLSILM